MEVQLNTQFYPLLNRGPNPISLKEGVTSFGENKLSDILKFIFQPNTN